MAAVRSPLRVALLAAAVVLTSFAASSPVRADSARLREARAHYEQAVANYNLDEFAPALAEFREAYRIKPDPSFLFNIAQCHRKLGQNDAALDFYRKYLRNLPDAPNRADVERMIAELRAKEAAPQAEAPVATPPPAPIATPAPAPPPQLEAPAPEVSLIATPAAPPPQSSPVYKRWWFWTGIGVIVVSAVVIGVVASSKGSQPYVGNLGPNLPLEVR